MILLIAIYTYYNFRFFAMPDEHSRNRVCRLQNAAMLFIHVLAYTVIYLRTEEEKMLMFFGAQFLFFLLYQVFYRMFYRNLSRLLLNNTCMLLCVSFIMLSRISFDRAVRQFVIAAVAAVVASAPSCPLMWAGFLSSRLNLSKSALFSLLQRCFTAPLISGR